MNIKHICSLTLSGLLLLGLFLTFPSIAVAMNGQGDSVRYGTYVRNDSTIYYGECNGVRMTVDVRRSLSEPVISIVNNSDREFVFDPSAIIVRCYAVPDIDKSYRRKIALFPHVKSDLKGLTLEQIEIYTHREYTKRFNRSSFWENMLATAITSLAYVDDPTALNIITYQDHEQKEAAQTKSRKYIDESYWRRNTIFPNTSHVGFISLRKLKADNIVLDIPVGKTVFHFEIIPQKTLRRSVR